MSIYPRKLLMTAFGLGLLKPAPGTWGSTPPVVLALAWVWLLGPGWILNVALLVMALLFSIGCVALGEWAERRFAGKDPGQVVADEVAGQCIALLFLPWRSLDDDGAMMFNGLLALGAFACFRFFDITKLPPINRLQKLPSGWGILVDDLVAGAYALIVMQIVCRLLI